MLLLEHLLISFLRRLMAKLALNGLADEDGANLQFTKMHIHSRNNPQHYFTHFRKHKTM